jgi:hypothetical protein
VHRPLTILPVLVALITSPLAYGSSRSHPLMQDRALVFLLPSHWTAAGGLRKPTTTTPMSSDLLIAADFRLPHSPRLAEGFLPAAPPGSFVISIVHYPAKSASAQWPSVKDLVLPRQVPAQRTVTWHARFDGEAIVLTIETGSDLTSAQRITINAFLSGIRHT